jgi:peroxiredoxin Q/BCP
MSAQPELVSFGDRRKAKWFPLAAVGLAAGASFLGLMLFRPSRTSSPPAPLDLAAEARADLERREFRPLSGELNSLLTDPDYKPIPTQVHPLLGKTAPDFTIRDTDDKVWTLSEQRKGGPLVLVFYYGYHCNHCVSQLFGLQKDIERFRELGAKVVAVSADPPELTRERFQTNGAFPFPVLSDTGNRVAQQYGTFTPSSKLGDDGNLVHGTFVIDCHGRLVWANRGDEPFIENRTLIRELHRCRPRDERSAPPATVGLANEGE